MIPPPLICQVIFCHVLWHIYGFLLLLIIKWWNYNRKFITPSNKGNGHESGWFGHVPKMHLTLFLLCKPHFSPKRVRYQSIACITFGHKEITWGCWTRLFQTKCKLSFYWSLKRDLICGVYHWQRHWTM